MRSMSHDQRYLYLIGHQQHGLWRSKERAEAQIKGGLRQAAAVLGDGCARVHEGVVHGRVGLGSVWAAPGPV